MVLIAGAKFAHVAAAAQSREKMTWLVGSNIGVSLVLFGAKLWSTGAKFVWLVVSTPLKNISQLFTQGGRRSHSQHAVMQTTGIEETRLASESSRKEKKERSAD